MFLEQQVKVIFWPSGTALAPSPACGCDPGFPQQDTKILLKLS
jgi:hypothetical protein